MTTIAIHRPARHHPQLPANESIGVPLPPTLADSPSRLAAGLTALSPLMISLGSVAFMLTGGGARGWLIYVLPGVMVAGVLMSMGVRWAQKRAGDRRQHTYASRYLAHLEEREVLLRERARVQRRANERLRPGLPALEVMAASRRHLWERRVDDPDFLVVRLGHSRIPLLSPAALEARVDPLADYEPELLDAARALVERYTALADGPVTIDLAQVGSLAVVGDRRRGRALVRALLLQLGVLCAADDLGIGICFPAGARSEWEWAKWLPHSRDRQLGTASSGSAPWCLLADSAAGLVTVLSHVAKPRTDRLARLQAVHGSLQRIDAAEAGRLVLVIDGFNPGGAVTRHESLRDLYPVAAAAGITLISLVDGAGLEPSHVDARIELDDAGRMVYAETRRDGRTHAGIVAEVAGVGAAEAVARMLAPVRLEERRPGRETGESIRLLELLGIASPSAIDPGVAWQASSRSQLMRVPLGLGTDGEPLVLDLKEAAEGGMGPHGLVIGATGSGKSELLRTLVTGLAVGHAPDLLNFVFVDFKGGAAFADLAELPHVAGMITNLQGDLSRVDRMHAALAGEQERRQRMLRDAGNLDGIKEYQVRREQRPDLAAMPYLMIVVDEFGELLAARPDFLDLFIAIGRVGRSLGMQLLLASQRLEEGRIRGLEGHLRYRVCLRTFSPQESQTVLGTADAYHLPASPGAGYFKVDTTVYRRFKTALISAPFDEARSALAGRAPVTVFSGVTSEESSAGAVDAMTETGRGSALPTEMELAIEQLNRRGRCFLPTVHQVWLPPLEAAVPLDAAYHLAGRHPDEHQPFGPLRVPLGVVDLPAKQEQRPLIHDFSGTGGHLAVVGAPQTGRSTFLRTLVVSLGLTHSPQEVQIYCIDLGGGTLHGLNNLPHVSAVAGKLEPDKLRRIVRQISSIIEEREVLFRKHAIDSMASVRRRRGSEELPAEAIADAFLIIDNWAQFRQEFEAADTEIAQLCATGLTYGVHLVITAGRWADIRSNLRDSISGRLEFRLNDPMDSEMPRGAAKALPANAPGRGLTPQGLQFQTALPRTDGGAGTADLQFAVATMVERVRRRWSASAPAPAVRLLPLLIRVAELPDPDPTGPPGVALGVEEFRLQPVYLDLMGAESHALVLGDSESGKTTLMRAWMHQLGRRHRPAEVRFVLVDYRRTLLDAKGSNHLAAYATTPALTSEIVADLHRTLIARLPPAEVTREQLVARSWWSGPELFLFVDDYDLVASPAGSPLQPLVELLAQGRDVGFHLVLARRVGGASRSAFEAVFQRVRELGSPGLVMSGDAQEGPLLGSQRAQPLPPGRGFLVRRGRPNTLIQTVRVDAPDG